MRKTRKCQEMAFPGLTHLFLYTGNRISQSPQTNHGTVRKRRIILTPTQQQEYNGSKDNISLPQRDDCETTLQKGRYKLHHKIQVSMTRPRGYSLRLKIKHSDWLFADTCPQAANHWRFFLSLRMNSSFITSRPCNATISDQPMAPRGRDIYHLNHTTARTQLKQSNQLFLPQKECDLRSLLCFTLHYH